MYVSQYLDVQQPDSVASRSSHQFAGVPHDPGGSGEVGVLVDGWVRISRQRLRSEAVLGKG